MAYIIKRFFISVFTLFAIVTITFFLMHMIPGGPFVTEKPLPPAVQHNLEVKFGLDKPLFEQYGLYVGNLLKGDMGVSINTQVGRDVTQIIGTTFPVSMRLGLISVAFALLVGIILGIISALKSGKAADNVVMFIATIGTSVPSFVIASVSMIVFGVSLKLLPTYGLDSWKNYILPGFALSFFPLSFISRLMRSSMLDVISQDYIKTARAKGLKEISVIYKHAVRNAILPIVTYLGPLLAGVMTGSFVIETIFTVPGLGKYFVGCIINRDYNVIMGTTIFFGTLMICMNFLVDILYMLVDPRIKMKQ